MSSWRKSFRYFPADMLVLSGVPILCVALLANFIFSLAGSKSFFVWALAGLIALTGAALMTWAKLPLYRMRIYFSFGPARLPDARRVYYGCGLGLVALGCSLLFVMAIA